MTFPHAWHVVGGLVGKRVAVTVGQGFVNGYEPIVKGRPISGMLSTGRMSPEGPPVVTGDANFDSHGRIYICVRVKVDPATGRMAVTPGEDDLTIVIEPATRLGTGANAGRLFSDAVYWSQPLAVLSDTGHLAQVAHFHYQHYTARRSPGGLGARWYHFFAPA